MSDLRKQIRGIVGDHNQDPEDETSRVFGAIAKAMTSPEAVQAFAETTGYDYEGSIQDGIVAAMIACGIDRGWHVRGDADAE